MLDSGLRASEPGDLLLEEADFESGRMHISRGKGNKQRVVRFGDEARLAIQHYLGGASCVATAPDTQLFAQGRSRPELPGPYTVSCVTS